MPRKKLLKTEDELTQQRYKVFELLLFSESDRGVVLVSTSFLDQALEVLLRAYFGYQEHKVKVAINPLFNTFGPLAAYATKIKLSYALNLIAEWTYKDLEIIREIRNRFAHDIDNASFDDPEVFRLTERLKGADRAATYRSKKDNKDYNEKPNTQEQPLKNTKENNKPLNKKQMEKQRLVMTVAYIAGFINSKTSAIQSLSNTQRMKLRVQTLSNS